MDFDLTHEQRQILDYGDTVAKKFDRKYWMECADKRVFPEALYQQIAEDGFVGTMVPEQYGGAGQGMVEMHLFLEGLSNNGIPLLNLVVGAAMSLGFIAKYGSEAQKNRYLPDACSGKTRFCFAITEPDAGTQHDPHGHDGDQTRQPFRAQWAKDVHYRRRWLRLRAGGGAYQASYRGCGKRPTVSRCS